MRDASLTNLGGEHRAKPVPPEPNGLVMSIPRSANRSSTLRSDSGYRTCVITTRRMTSGELLKYRNRLLMRRGEHSRDSARICSDAAIGHLTHERDIGDSRCDKTIEFDKKIVARIAAPTPPPVVGQVMFDGWQEMRSGLQPESETGMNFASNPQARPASRG
jgi:hypothetical protein